MLLPALSRARESARLTVCNSNLRQLYVGYVSYVSNWNEYLPWGGYVGVPGGHFKWATGGGNTGNWISFADLLYPYVGSYAVYTCAAESRPDPAPGIVTPKLSYRVATFGLAVYWFVDSDYWPSVRAGYHSRYGPDRATKVKPADQLILFVDSWHYTPDSYNSSISFNHFKASEVNMMYYLGTTGRHNLRCSWAVYPAGDPAQTHFRTAYSNPAWCSCGTKGY